MISNSRHGSPRSATQLAAASVAMSVVPEGVRRVLAIPVHNTHHNIEDVQHIVVLMQENRSFDHYFGTPRGVCRYGDMHTVMLPSDKSVGHQPIIGGAGEVLPSHPSASDFGLQFLGDLPHGWNDAHLAVNDGCYGDWVPHEGITTMAYLTRQDIPFHYALVDAFTIYDAYHCATPTSIDPNRYYMWIGYTDNNNTSDGPAIDNAEAGCGWSTYPEVPEVTGILWKVYQDVGTGLDTVGLWGWTNDTYIGNYDNNSLPCFKQYQNAQPGNPLYDKMCTGANAAAGEDYFDVPKRNV